MWYLIILTEFIQCDKYISNKIITVQWDTDSPDFGIYIYEILFKCSFMRPQEDNEVNTKYHGHF